MAEPGPPLPLRTLSGFGRTHHALAHVARPQRRSQLATLLENADGAMLARGCGRAYGDAALIGGGTVVDMTRLDRLMEFDARSGVLVCEAGVRLSQIDRLFVPRGHSVPVVPGTGWVSVGGAIAADVHGKNHDRAGSFGDHVRWLDLLTADGAVRRVDPIGTPALFAATVGGMGLTGIIVQAAIGLQPGAQPAVMLRERRMSDLDALLAAMAGNRATAASQVAWIDAMAGGRNLGRAVLSIAEPAGAPPGLAPRRVRKMPLPGPDFLPLRQIGRAFNAVWLTRVSAAGRSRLVAREDFLYPLDSLAGWNGLYGRRGFRQFQCVLPEAQAAVGLRRLLEATAQSRAGALLATLKTMGAPGRGYLSFARAGHALALDIPNRVDAGALLERLEGIALECGGRVNLAKDSALSPAAFATMYPELPRQRAVLEDVDRQGRFQSDLARRLGIRDYAP